MLDFGVSKNMIVSEMTIVRICWLKSHKFHYTYRNVDKSLARPGRKQATFPHFMELGGSLPRSQESTTCPYRSEINPFLCPSHF